MRRLSLLLVFLATLARAQAAGSGGSLPATCVTGDAFFLATILAPSGWYNCASTNNWQPRSSGGQGDLVAANNLSDVASTATALSNLGAQASNAKLASIAATTFAADKCNYFSDATTVAAFDCPSFGRSIVAAVDAAAARTVLGAEPAGTYSGIGACGANQWASTLNDAASPTCTQPGFSNLSGSASDAQVPDTITITNLTQVSTRAISDTTGTLTVSRGGTGAAPGADDQLLVADSTSAATWKALNDCQGAGKALTYTASSNTFGCNTISGSGPTYVLLTANRTNATTSYADITDLVFAVAANTRYDVECKFIYAANATTTGIGIGWTGPASPTLVGGQMRSGLTSATVGGTTSVGNDTGGVTTASVATSGNFATFEGFWSNGANAGNVQMRFKSEVAVASAIVIQSGSWCKYNSY